MDPELQTTLEELADYVFAQAEPTPDGLEKLHRALPPGHVRLVGLFLNVRLALRWQGFGVTHSSISLDQANPSGAVPLRIRAFNPDDLEAPVHHVLVRSGFLGVVYREDRLATGGWIHALASAPLVERLRS